MGLFARRLMSGEARGATAAILRGALSAAEPFYAGAAVARNWLFDQGLRRSHRLPRPVISIGNLTTGGTGKTPVVRWLAERLRDQGRRVAVLARGYGARQGQSGDEQLMLGRLLNDTARLQVAVVANPDRRAAAKQLLRDRPDTDVLILDDGFQHRRVARDLDVVLVSATSPFGYGHVLPRGMLREPLSGLRRAGAVVITHADQVSAEDLVAIERRVRDFNADVPVYRAVHEHAAFRDAAGALHPVDELKGLGWFALSAIGDPDTFIRQLSRAGGRRAGESRFPDHHQYTSADLAAVRAAARTAGADVIVTTEKDWSKLAALAAASPTDLPVWRVDLRIRFLDDSKERLWQQVVNVIP